MNLHRNRRYRLVRKYENLRRRLSAMLADGSFHLMEACRRMELLRKLSRRFRALQRPLLRASLSTAVLAAGFLFLVNTANAATGFVPQVNRFPFGNDNPLSEVDESGPVRPCFGNFDGDDDLDVLLGLNDGTTDYYRNYGIPIHADLQHSGDLLPGVDVGDDAMPTDGDLDGDGDLDLVLGEYDGLLHYFENTGTATAPAFAERTGAENPFDSIDVGNGSCPLLVDLDDDGDLDLVLGAAGDTPLLYYENIGTATAPNFAECTGAANPFQDSLHFPAPAAADLDGDGDLDLLVGNLYGNLFLFENTGRKKAPVFTMRTGTANPFNGIDLGSDARPALADIDNDGDADALVGNGSGTVAFFENIGTPAAADFVSRQTQGYFSSPAFADLDGDGDLDLALGVNHDLPYAGINYFQNIGTATEPEFAMQTGGDNPFDGVLGFYFDSPSLVDIDDDGDYDLFLGTIYYPTLIFYENTGDANNPAFALTTGAANPFDGIDLSYFPQPDFVDIDNDGDFDCFAGEKYGAMRFFENTGTAPAPAFIERFNYDNPLYGMFPESYLLSPSFADFDDDGDFDCFIGQYQRYTSVGTLYIENIGSPANPRFTEADGGANPFAGITVPSYIPTPAVVDIDNDGDMEVFIGGKYGSAKYYALAECIARGAGFRIHADEVEGPGGPLATFAKEPAVRGTYFDPVKDLMEHKRKTARATVLTRVDAAAPPDSILCEWKKNIKLIDHKTLRTAYRQGDSAATLLTQIQQHPLSVDLAVSTVDDTGQRFTDGAVKTLTIMPPIIYEVVNLNTMNQTYEAAGGELLLIRGMHFGDKKAKVWLEYVDDRGKTRTKALKPFGTKPYPDANGTIKKGYMDPVTGDSLLILQMPTRWPKDWNHADNHNLVLDNGVGLATFFFGTTP